MKLRVFQSDKGDCMLLTSSDGKNVLIDGGMSASYREHVAPALNLLQQSGTPLDAVYVSHIDQDHIAGVLRMAGDLVAWKVFDFQRAHNNPTAPMPNMPRPPEILKVWNNSFHEQVGDNEGDIADLLAARARVLTLIPSEVARDAAERHANLAQSKAEAVELSRRLGPRQLGIPINPEFDHKLMFVTDPPDPIAVGSLRFTVIGPFKEDLAKLRDEWKVWLETAQAEAQIGGIHDRMERDEELLGNAATREVLGSLLSLAAVLGKRSEVTVPNLASLMFFVEDSSSGTTLLATGDGHWKDILNGLEAGGFVDEAGGLHVDVLKVQHHGSEHNWHHDFGRRITADHYVFCGNGDDENPDLKVVGAVLDSRFGSAAKRSANPETGNRFDLWFNCASSIAKPAHKAHMKKIENKVRAAETAHPGLVVGHFLEASHFDLEI